MTYVRCDNMNLKSTFLSIKTGCTRKLMYTCIYRLLLVDRRQFAPLVKATIGIVHEHK